MSSTMFATIVLRADALANAALGAGTLALLGTLTRAAGLTSSWPAAVVGVVLLANGVGCWRAGRSDKPAPPAMRGLAVVDAAFVIAVLWFALAGPTGMETWLRTVLLGLAGVVLVVAAIKALLAARISGISAADATAAR